MKQLSHEQKRRLGEIGIVLLALLVLGSLIWFVGDVKEEYRAGELRPDYINVRNESPQQQQQEQNQRVIVTVDTIQPWMTFDYLNVVFKMPSLYLQNALAITDHRYPNIRMDSYIRSQHLDPTFFMKNVQQAITSYQNSK